MVKVVVQTRPLSKSRTGAIIAKVFQAAVTNWELKTPNHGFTIVTDNAHNSLVYLRVHLHLAQLLHTLLQHSPSSPIPPMSSRTAPKHTPSNCARARIVWDAERSH